MASYRFPPSERVRRRTDFVRAYEGGTKVVRGPLVLFARRTATGRVRLGVTATRKVGNAVVRNRAKRLVREAFRQDPINAMGGGGWDLVVVVRPRLLGLRPEEIAPVLREAAAKGMAPCE